MNNICFIKIDEESIDYDLLYRWCQNEFVYEWFEQRKLSFDEIKNKYYKKITDNNQKLFYISIDGQYIGYIQYYVSLYKNIDLSGDIYEYDLFIGESNYLSKGFGTQIINKLNKYIFEDEKCDFIILNVFARNYRAIRAYEKANFKKIDSYSGEDTLGKKEEMVVMAISKDKFLYSLSEITKDELRDYMYVNCISWNETYKGIMLDDFLKKITDEFDNNVLRLINKFDQTKIDEPDYKRYILRVNDEAVGILGICKSRDENYLDSGELCSLYLLNKMKNNGYGKIMFERAKEELRKMNYKDMIIYCIKENPTNNFYQHMGCRLVGSKERNIGGKDFIENIYYYENL